MLLRWMTYLCTKAADVKSKIAQSIISEVVTTLRQRAEALDIKEDLILLVEKDLRINML